MTTVSGLASLSSTSGHESALWARDPNIRVVQGCIRAGPHPRHPAQSHGSAVFLVTASAFGTKDKESWPHHGETCISAV
jgi:hypothetical protein